MTWAEFRRWAFDVHGVTLPLNSAASSARYAMWTSKPRRGRTLTGSGNSAEYGAVQLRRFSVWVRASGLISHACVGPWLDAAEPYDSGWLVNDGLGIRWVEHPEREAHELVQRGFVAVKCGL